MAAGWGLALAVLIVASFAARAEGRMWARRAVALLALYLIALALAGWLLPAEWAAWGSALAAFAVFLTAQTFISLGVLTPAEIGLTAPRPGTMRVVVLAVGLALLLNVVVMIVRGAAPVRLAGTTVAAVLVAAVLEELVFRGVLLALLDRALPQRWRIAGAYIGWGGVALTAVLRRAARTAARPAGGRAAGGPAISLAARTDRQPAGADRRAPRLERLRPARPLTIH